MRSDDSFLGWLSWPSWVLGMLWVCRVSLLSAVAGLLLFGFAVPAQNLMADLSYSSSWPRELLYWTGVFALTFFMWAFPIHYAARTTLDRPDWVTMAVVRRWLPAGEGDALFRRVRERYPLTILWLPRALGLMPFVALGLGIWFGAKADIGARALPAGGETIAQAWWLGAADVLTALSFLLFVVGRRRLTERMALSSRGIGVLGAFAWLAVGLTTAYFALAYFAPIMVSIWTPRALLVPPLFGSLVLGLNWIAGWGRRTGVPVFGLMAAFALGLTALNAPFNDLRTLTPVAGEPGRLRIADAVAAWKSANGCADRACPRPVVVAIDGGASRAAFTAATDIGDLLDKMAPPGPGEASTPGRRLFAISGVSGGAYGAAVIQAALADAQSADPLAAPRPPCRTAGRTWFRYPTWEGERFSWRECLQALTSGDYLSTTIIGLAFRDAFAPPHMPIEDRATLLEQSFERHYDHTVRSHPGLLDGGDICRGPARTGLCRTMAHPAAFLASHRGGWMPLLLLNGTSVETGRRLISSDLASSPSRIGGNGSLYNEAFDLREAMSSPCPAVPKPRPLGTTYADDVTADASMDEATVRTRTHGTCAGSDALDGPDIRLSTAALVSARFPLISPAGAFVMKGSPKPFGDQVVDGGYFENSGITTALDVVAALREVELDPILLSIGNDPEAEALVAGLPRRPSATPLVLASTNGFVARAFSFVAAPLDTLLATRDGHADEAVHDAQAHFPDAGFYRMRVDEAPDFAGADGDTACRTIWQAWVDHKKSLTMTEVSMSWWLSAAVQADLDAQRCTGANRAVIAAVLEQIRPPSSGGP